MWASERGVSRASPRLPRRHMHVSVLVATYNGERWLSAQLDSLLQQDHQPDQVVITDDGSVDATPDLIDDFVARAPFEVRVLRRESPIGYTENFVRALSACHGEVVFFCDQDDVWFPEKISAVIHDLATSGASLVVHDQVVVDEQLCPQPLSMLERLRRAGLHSDQHRKGCATAARRSFINSALPVGPGFAFDTWFHDVAAAVEKRRVLQQELMAYRVHGDNTSTFFLNRLEPPDRRNAVTLVLAKTWVRLRWFLAPVAVIEEQAREFEAVIQAAHAYLQDTAQASLIPPERLQQLEAEAQRLHDRARQRRSSTVWRGLYRVLATHRR